MQSTATVAMFVKSILVAYLFAASVAQAAPQNYGDSSNNPTQFGPDSQVAASAVTSQPAYPVISSQVTGTTSHGAFSGMATTTGAVQSGPAAKSIPALGPNPTETYYNPTGELTKEEPAPYAPAG